ncbi:hypothetical protein [Circovirus-like genome DCCV-5]|uniref:Uncharacterized protein n=1 Tax=Circovirus-like genome DCCV-5 TaxID=1788445 RepID=A0A190WHA6_9VIRU|nr:hypothetical protein [Circovirus-like genome DCCV-5]AMB42963.1 hypothetical protein [Circovirus-like genome DCCV-5]
MTTQLLTPGSTHSGHSIALPVGRSPLVPEHLTYRDTPSTLIRSPSPPLDDYLWDVTWSPPVGPDPNPELTALRMAAFAREVSPPPMRTPGTGRSSVGRTPVPWLRRASSTRFPLIYTSDTSETSTGSIERFSRPWSPSPLPAGVGSWEELDLVNLRECDQPSR